MFRFCREIYTVNEYNVQNKCWKLNLNFTKSSPVRCCSLMCLVSEITQKKDKLQTENILDILQIKFGTRYMREHNLKVKHSSSVFAISKYRFSDHLDYNTRLVSSLMFFCIYFQLKSLLILNQISVVRFIWPLWNYTWKIKTTENIQDCKYINR